MHYRSALIALILVLPLTSCSNDNDRDTESGSRSKTNQEKIKGFNNCISGGLGSNAVEIKNKIDKCSEDNLDK
jgi:hypothetical protein